ncbi:MAG TPA: hypothetical protein VF936_11845 [Burkholderiales bacterium]
MRGRGEDPLTRAFHYNVDEARRAEDRHQKEREILFGNETLAVQVLQAVSGAALIAGISQAEALSKLAGRISLLLFLTAMAVALIVAVFAVHWKHQYKMWDVKAAAADNQDEMLLRSKRSGWYLVAMRRAMWVSLISIALGFIQLLVFLWIIGLRAVTV